MWSQTLPLTQCYFTAIVILKRFAISTSIPGSLSSASLVIGRKTLVATGHVTTAQVGKKFTLEGGVRECLLRQDLRDAILVQ